MEYIDIVLLGNKYRIPCIKGKEAILFDVIAKIEANISASLSQLNLGNNELIILYMIAMFEENNLHKEQLKLAEEQLTVIREKISLITHELESR